MFLKHVHLPIDSPLTDTLNCLLDRRYGPEVPPYSSIWKCEECVTSNIIALPGEVVTCEAVTNTWLSDQPRVALSSLSDLSVVCERETHKT